MPWQIVRISDKLRSSPELSTVDVFASIIEPKLANTLVRQLNQICPLENLRHVKRVKKRLVEGKIELSVILCLHHEIENIAIGMPNDVLQLASTYQLSPFKAKVAKYAALSKEEWEEQCKLWPTSYHPSTNHSELTGFDEKETHMIINYMKLAMKLMKTSDGKVVNSAVIVDPLNGKVIASGQDQTFFQLSANETISSCEHDCEQSAVASSFQLDRDTSGNILEESNLILFPRDFSGVSCLYPRRWAEPISDNQKAKFQEKFHWHPLRHAALVSIENAAARDRKLFPCIESQMNRSLRNGGLCDCSDDILTKRQKIELADNVGMVVVDASSKSLPSEVLRPYLCTGFDIYIVWEPCAMCAMALLHQRVRRIFYSFPNPNAGALGSIYRLQGEKSLNHHYSVFRILIPEESH